MTQPIHLIADIYCLPIPEDAHHIVMHNDPPKIIFSSKIQDPAQCGGDMIVLPPGNWEIICTTKECTEEQAKGIVLSSEWFFPVKHTRYVDYKYPYDRENKQRWSEGFGSALGSFVSLLETKGLNPETNYLIIKKVS